MTALAGAETCDLNFTNGKGIVMMFQRVQKVAVFAAIAAVAFSGATAGRGEHASAKEAKRW